MKKRILCLLLLPLCSLFAQQTDLQTFDLKGRVKEVRYYKNAVLTQIKRFNTDGNSTKTVNFGAQKPLDSTITVYDDSGLKIRMQDDNYTTYYQYDSLKNLLQWTLVRNYNQDTIRVEKNEFVGKNRVKTTSYNYTPVKKEMFDKVLFEYDSKNRLVKEINYGISNVKPIPNATIEDRSPILFTYTYSPSHLLLEKVGKTETGLITSRMQYNYDSHKNKIEYRYEWSNTTASGYETYTYDVHNQLIEMHCYASDNTLIYKELFTYDASGNQLSRAHYYKNELTSLTENRYDANNNAVEVRQYQKGKLYDIKHRVFDAVGNEIELKISDSQGTLLYEFKKEIVYY